MARTVTDKRLNRVAHSFSAVVDNICRGQYVLVLGSDIILDKSKNYEADGDSTRFYLNKVIDYIREDRGVNYKTTKTFSEFIIKNSLNSEDVRSWLFDVLATTELDYEDLNPDLIRLLATKFFRVVLTTVFDPSIELLMDEVWGKGQYRVMNVFNGKSNNFDFNSNEFLGDEYFDITPTLYYAFGKAELNNEGQFFVLDDNDTLKGISLWLGNEAPQQLLSYISTKKLLSIGCNFKDWCFRFFWYAMRDKESTKLHNGDIAAMLDTNNSEQDKNLYNYLKDTIKVSVQTDSREYISRLADALNQELVANTALANSHLGGIFISYATEDFAIAWNVFTRLRDAGFNVWLDNQKLDVSDTYSSRIVDAINQSKVFIPLITPNVAADLTTGVDRYFHHEWELATGPNTGIRFFPIVTFDYDYNSEYHTKVPEQIRNVTFFKWTKEPFDVLVNKIKRVL